MRSLIYIILGAIIVALGIWWMIPAGFTVQGILAAIVVAIGGTLVTTGLGGFADSANPTSKKV